MSTMNDAYGDGSNHEICSKCGLCIQCGDCETYGCGEFKKETHNYGNLIFYIGGVICGIIVTILYFKWGT